MQIIKNTGPTEYFKIFLCLAGFYIGGDAVMSSEKYNISSRFENMGSVMSSSSNSNGDSESIISLIKELKDEIKG